MEMVDKKMAEQSATLSNDSQIIVDLIKQKLGGCDGIDFFLDSTKRTVTVYLSAWKDAVSSDTARQQAFQLLIKEAGSEWSSIESNRIIDGLKREIILHLKAI